MEEKITDKTDHKLLELVHVAVKRKANEGANSKSKKKRRRAAKVAHASRVRNG